MNKEWDGKTEPPEGSVIEFWYNSLPSLAFAYASFDEASIWWRVTGIERVYVWEEIEAVTRNSRARIVRWGKE